MIKFSNSELKALPESKDGDEIECPHCGSKHTLKDSNPPMLLFYNCGSKTYLAAVGGRNIMSRLRTPGDA
jgi:hypothetical protein